LVGAVAVTRSSSNIPMATTTAPLVTVVIDGGSGIPVVFVAAVGDAVSNGVVVLTPL
jgi:hypothetical protein